MSELDGSSERQKWLNALLSGIREHALTVATLGVAAYVIIRGELEGYKATQLAFLIALLIAILGLNALDSIVDRSTRSPRVSRQLSQLEIQLRESRADVGAVAEKLRHVELILDGLRLDAVASQFLHDEVDIPRERLRRAGMVYWSGVTLRASLRLHLAELGTALSHGARLTVLVADPSSERLVSELVDREKAKREYIDGVLKSMVLNMQVLASHLPAGHSFRLGFHQTYPTYGLTIIDPDEPDGICLVDIYHPDRDACSSFNVHATADAAWFAFFVKEFHALLAACRTSDVEEPNDVEAVLAASSEVEPSAGESETKPA